MKLLLGLVLVSACGIDVPSDPTLGSGDDTTQPPPAPTATPLISGAWNLGADSENYICVRQTITTDTYIKTIVPNAPIGTHHFVLMVGDPDAPDGISACDSALAKPAIFASGVGVQPLSMPDGIAIHLAAGQQLLLNLHLFNATDEPISGTSGIAYEPSEPVDAAHSAGVVLAGKSLGLTVAVGSSTQAATCTTTAGMTMFAVAPHMHLLGTHLQATYNGATLYDSDYVFDDQQFRMIQPTLTTDQGKYHVTCSYTNYTGSVVKFGESTTDEMCYAITFAYPAPTQKTCGF